MNKYSMQKLAFVAMIGLSFGLSSARFVSAAEPGAETPTEQGSQIKSGEQLMNGCMDRCLESRRSCPYDHNGKYQCCYINCNWLVEPVGTGEAN